MGLAVARVVAELAKEVAELVEVVAGAVAEVIMGGVSLARGMRRLWLILRGQVLRPVPVPWPCSRPWLARPSKMSRAKQIRLLLGRFAGGRRRARSLCVCLEMRMRRSLGS